MLIEWVDAVTVGDSSWQTYNDLDLESSPPLMKTVGTCLYQCDTHVCLTDTIGPEECGHMTKIPCKMIVRAVVLEEETKEETNVSDYGLR